MISIDYKTALVVVGAGAALLWWQKRNLEAIAQEFTSTDGALNPVNDENLANSAFNGVWHSVSGSNEAFGADLYDLFSTGSIFGNEGV